MHRLFFLCALCVSLGPWIPQTMAGGPLTPTPLGKINTDKEETDPFLAADNKSLLYASNESGTYDLYLAGREPTKLQWNSSQALEPFNTKDADERRPIYTTAKYFYFSSNRIPDPSFKDLQNFDIYERFGPRAPTAMIRVSTKADEMSPWVAEKGKAFYFNRKTDDGIRLFVSKGPALGAVDEGTLVESIPAGFVHPTTSADGKTMYLQGPLENDRWGIFRSTRKGDAWSEPKAVTNLNHPDGKLGDMAPSLSASGTTLFFASDRPGGAGGIDLYYVRTADLKVSE